METRSAPTSTRWCEAYAKLKSYQNLVIRTHEFIGRTLKLVKKPYVACSFGKDSSVMLDMVLKHNPNILVRFASHPETRLLDNYSQVIDWWRARGINYEEIYCEGRLVKVKHHQRNMLSAGDFDGFFVGIRAEESVGRRISLRRFTQYHRLPDGRAKICPVAWWTTRDIITYIVTNGLPCLNKYRDEGFDARTTSGIPRTHIHETLSSLRQRDKHSFNALRQLFPEVDYFV